SAASRVCRPQTSQARQPRITGAACARRERINTARPAAAARIRTTRIHFGHAPRKANWPREYTERGYLKKNSNIRAITSHWTGHELDQERTAWDASGCLK